jgi:chromosome segregation ATPase
MKKKQENNMGDFISQHWLALLGGGTITSITTWVFYGRKNNNADFTTKVQGIYEKLADDLNEFKNERDLLKKENRQLQDDHRKDVLYFRNQVDEVRKGTSVLQGQFNEMTMAYTKEVEVSKNWEKQYKELFVKYNELEKSHEDLKKDHELLKKEIQEDRKKKRTA